MRQQAMTLTNVNQVPWHHMALPGFNELTLLLLKWDNFLQTVYTMATDGSWTAAESLDPCSTRLSAIIILNMPDKLLFVFHKEGFQLPAPSQCWEMIKCQYTNLTHWDTYKMAGIFNTFSNAFSVMKMFEFLIQFHLSSFLKVQLTIIQHWFRWWLGA